MHGGGSQTQSSLSSFFWKCQVPGIRDYLLRSRQLNHMPRLRSMHFFAPSSSKTKDQTHCPSRLTALLL